jgi:hypothetical protein
MSADAPPRPDVRTLSLAQLQRLAVRGSRRARAELERRMAGMDARTPPLRSEPPPAAPAPRLVTAASLDQMTAQAASGANARAPGMTFPGNHDAPPQIPQDAQILHLHSLAQQEEARQRAEGPPGLMGMALIAWGALMLFGGLALLTRIGSLYYILSGLACMGIGWLLLRCRRTAIWAHVACAAAALLWAWRGYAGNSAFTALIQSAPIWIAALWIAIPTVREPLN